VSWSVRRQGGSVKGETTKKRRGLKVGLGVSLWQKGRGGREKSGKGGKTFDSTVEWRVQGWVCEMLELGAVEDHLLTKDTVVEGRFTTAKDSREERWAETC